MVFNPFGIDGGRFGVENDCNEKPNYDLVPLTASRCQSLAGCTQCDGLVGFGQTLSLQPLDDAVNRDMTHGNRFARSEMRQVVLSRIVPLWLPRDGRPSTS